MLEELLPYYERELAYLRQLSGEFAQRYPKIAQRLLIETEQCEDPHVERMIEGFAFLAARIHRKLDDEYPEISEAMLQVLYPHYTQPLPSATIVQMEIDHDKPDLTGRSLLARHQVVNAPDIHGVTCRFRTCYDVELWPLQVVKAKLELTQASEYLRKLGSGAAVITLELETLVGLSLASIELDKLRFFLDGESPLMYLLYELLQTRVLSVRVTDGSDNPAHMVKLTKDAVQPVGFDAADGLLDQNVRSFPGYRLLSEYFAFPDKFLFIDVVGLDAAALRHSGQKLVIQFFLESYADSERYVRLQQTLSPANFKLGCTPIINLFSQAAEPIRVSHEQSTYPVKPGNRQPLTAEVIAIESVTRAEKTGRLESSKAVPPFYSIQHADLDRTHHYFWYATREQSTRDGDKGTEVELALVDLDFTPARPDAEVLSVTLLCSNRDLPEQIPFGGSNSDFNLPNQSIVRRVKLLRKPTSSLRAPAKRGLQWRLISHLTLNHLSLTAQGENALKEMLTLYNYTDSAAVSRQIQGIVAIDSRAATTRVSQHGYSGFVRGTEIDLTLDETYFVGSGLYLFASVLERFFAMYCSPNHFSRLRLLTKQQEGVVYTWTARAGAAVVI